MSPKDHDCQINGDRNAMWDTVDTTATHLSHDLPCTECGHGRHTYLPCSDSCHCVQGRDRALTLT